MKNKLKALSAILLFTMLFSLLATLTSCKKDGTTDTKDTTGGSNTELVDTSLPELEIKDFGGYKMQILWPETHPDGHWIHNEISVEETGSDVINQAVRNRNKRKRGADCVAPCTDASRHAGADPGNSETARYAGCIRRNENEFLIPVLPPSCNPAPPKSYDFGGAGFFEILYFHGFGGGIILE